MLLRGNDAKDFPKFSDYLYYRFPNITGSKTIVKNMMKYGNLGESALRAALSPGMPPIVDVTKIGDETGAFSDELGRIGKTQPGFIYLSKRLVSGFNEGPWFNENFFKNAKGQDVPVVGGVLLHFLCHWGNFVTGRPEVEQEMGNEFELATYGAFVYYSPASQ